MISLRYNLASQVTFPSNQAEVLSCAFSPAVVAATSAGWCTQAWPGTQSWPVAPLVPSVLYGQAQATASNGSGWLLSAWAGRGTWPYGFPTRDLRCQYEMQWAQKPVPAQIAQELAEGQTNLGSNDTTFCGRDFCTSGLYVAIAWMWKAHFTQCVFYLKAQKTLACSVLSPASVSYPFRCQYLVEFPVDNVDPFCQIYCSTVPLFFANNNLGSQYWAERTRILYSQWKKRPF